MFQFMPSLSHESIHTSFEPLEDSQIKVIGDDLVPSFIRVQEVSTVIYRIQLCRHIRIRQPSVEVEYCVEGSGSADEIIYTLYRCYSLWLCVCACCCVLCADCENKYAETEEVWRVGDILGVIVAAKTGMPKVCIRVTICLYAWIRRFRNCQFVA